MLVQLCCQSLTRVTKSYLLALGTTQISSFFFFFFFSPRRMLSMYQVLCISQLPSLHNAKAVAQDKALSIYSLLFQLATRTINTNY